MATLENRRVAILTEEGFEQVELTSPNNFSPSVRRRRREILCNYQFFFLILFS